MSTFDGFPELDFQQVQLGKATALLAQAVSQINSPGLDENYADVAMRMRGAATIVHAAVLEIGLTVGWFEAAAAASTHGLLDEGSEVDGNR